MFHDKMVLPVRIELTTSPLPRECSTTELRQPVRDRSAKARAYGEKRWTGQGDAPYFAGMGKNPDREKRLAEALRANLRKRKASAGGDGRAVEQPVVPVIPAGRRVEE
jgi:hypothetical protein